VVFLHIFIIALIAGLLTWVAFSLSDKKNKGSDERKTETSMPMHQASKKIQYDSYQMSSGERVLYITFASIATFLLSYIFYKSIILSLLAASLGFLFPRVYAKQLAIKRKNELAMQFKQALHSLTSSLVAGRSLENSFLEVVTDLKTLYPNPDTLIIREFELINKRVKNGEPIEQVFLDFSKRAGVEDITNFSDVLVTCKRTGGDLIEVVRKTSRIISEKLEIQQEISILFSQKRFESRVMIMAPFLVVAVLGFSSPDYMAPLYDFWQGGRFVMSFSLVALVFCFWLTNKIMDIKV
jgi:tight adherence protein B